MIRACQFVCNTNAYNLSVTLVIMKKLKKVVLKHNLIKPKTEYILLALPKMIPVDML